MSLTPPSATPLSKTRTSKRLSRAILRSDFADAHANRVNRHSFTIYVGNDPDHMSFADMAGTEPGVEYRMADRFEINLELLSAINSRRPILVQMASCGGCWEEGMQMFAAILACPNPVTVLSTKWARSMMSIIPLAADRFVMRPPAQYMIHHGYYGFDGTTVEGETAALELIKTTETMLRIYAVRLKERGPYSKWGEARIKRMLDQHMRMRSDVWLSADEAVEWGFADAVMDGVVTTASLRTTKRNDERRARMRAVLRRPVSARIVVA